MRRLPSDWGRVESRPSVYRSTGWLYGASHGFNALRRCRKVVASLFGDDAPIDTDAEFPTGPFDHLCLDPKLCVDFVRHPGGFRQVVSDETIINFDSIHWSSSQGSWGISQVGMGSGSGMGQVSPHKLRPPSTAMV